jgi:CarD family transcriptional regulator
MSLKVGSKVFYPPHGAGWIREEKEIDFNGDKQKYFEFELITNPLRISAPVDRIEELNIRNVMTKQEILDKVSVLKTKPTQKPKSTDFNGLLNIFKDLEKDADFDSSIEIIQLCNHVKKQREKEGRLIPVSIEKQLEGALKNIIGELAVSSGVTLKTASKTFSKQTGIEAEITE